MLYLVLFVAFVIGLLWVFQMTLLDDFYRAFKRRQVSGAAEVLLDNLDSEDLSELAGRLANQNDVSILLLDADMEELVSTESTRTSLLFMMDSRTLSRRCAQAPEDGSARESMFHIDPMSYVMNGSMPEEMDLPPEPPEWQEGGTGENTGRSGQQSGKEKRIRELGESDRKRFDAIGLEATRAMSLLYTRRVTLPEGGEGYLLLYAQITPVSATVSALRSQLLTITAIILVMALLLAAFISRRVSTPIIETNTAARELARSRYEKPRHADSYREISELNDTLAMAAQELGQVENLQHELIANISHDLRTPLTMIGGYAEAMRDIPDENTPENMQIIIDETARLSTLVNELLDFSRMQTGSVEMRMADYSLTGSVRQIVGRIGSMVAKDGYTVLFEPEEEARVTADESRIGQVVYNLIGNALTYTGEDRRVTVVQRLQGGKARIEVRDTGKGIAPEELPLIWNRYYRTKESHRRAIIGSGLGLNIVRTILEKHGAEYGVESRQGEGTAFWFELPLAEGKDTLPPQRS